MTDDSILDDLLIEAEMRWAAGSEGKVAEILADHPDFVAKVKPSRELSAQLERSFAALKAMHRDYGFGDLQTEPSLPLVDGFEMLEEIDRGGMGVVYRARQDAPSRLVAVKIMRGGLFARRRQRERFRVEADVVARLQHPNIVEIYETGQCDAGPFLVLELMLGGSLADNVGRFEHKPREAAQLVETLALAVDEAHKHGIVHRDIKPSNVLLSANGTPKLSDFGLARLQEDESNLTRTGETPGTPAYMAPEQMTGKSATTAVDIYALGAVLYELLVGKPPFRGSSHAETMVQVQTQEPVPPGRVRRDVPADLEAICLRCLEKLPERRYASAADLAADLKRFLTGQATKARPLSSLGVTMKWARRRPAAAALVATSALFFVIVLAGSLWYSTQLAAAVRVAEDRQSDANRARADAEENLAVAEAQERIASGFQYAVEMRQAFYSWESAELGEVEELLAHYDDGTRWASYRGFEWYYLNRLLHADLHTFRVDDPEVYDVAFSPDGKTLAACGQQGWVRFWDIESGELVRVLNEHRSCVNSLAYSADGNLLATASCDKTTKLWDPATGTELANLSSDGATMQCVEMGEDGLLAIGDDKGTILIYDTNSNRRLAKLDHDGAKIHGLAWSPDGKVLVSTNYEVGVRLWNTADWTYKSLPAQLRFSPCSVAFAPDGKTLATGTTQGHIHLWDVPSLVLQADLVHIPHFGHVRCLAYTPDGTKLISGADDKVVVVWDVDEARVVRRIRGHLTRIESIAVSPDSSKLATTALDGTIKVWDLNDPTDRTPCLRAAAAMGQAGSISPTGTRLAFASRKPRGQIEVWSIPQAKLISRTQIETVEHNRLSWSADDSLLEVVSSTPPEAYVWDLNRAKVIHKVMFPTQPAGRSVESILSPNGEDALFFQVDVPGLTIRNLERGSSQPLAYPGQVTKAYCFSDGKMVACVGHADDDVHVFSTDGQSHRVLNAACDRPPLSISVSKNGRFIAVGTSGGVIKVVDVESGRLHRVLRGHENDVNCIALSSDGRTVASADVGGLVKLWHLETGELMTTFSTNKTKPWQITFAPDDAALLCWCEAQTVTDQGTKYAGCELYVWSAR